MLPCSHASWTVKVENSLAWNVSSSVLGSSFTTHCGGLWSVSWQVGVRLERGGMLRTICASIADITTDATTPAAAACCTAVVDTSTLLIPLPKPKLPLPPPLPMLLKYPIPAPSLPVTAPLPPWPPYMLPRPVKVGTVASVTTAAAGATTDIEVPSKTPASGKVFSSRSSPSFLSLSSSSSSSS